MTMVEDYQQAVLEGDLVKVQFIEDMGYDLLANMRLFSKAGDLRLKIYENQQKRIPENIKKLKKEIPKLKSLLNQFRIIRDHMKTGRRIEAKHIFMIQGLLESDRRIPFDILTKFITNQNLNK